MSVISLESLDFLRSQRATQTLSELAAADLGEKHSLSLLTGLRRSYLPEEAAALLTMARLRQRALDKFGAEASQLFFTPDALEQASDPLVRAYRARMAAGQRVLDLCCSIGTDAMAMARAGAEVTGLDYDPLRIAIAQHNAAVLGLKIRFIRHDLYEPLPVTGDMIFYDPARRDEKGRRIHHVEQYQPPLSLLRNWSAETTQVKLSPGVDLAQLGDYGGGVEFISVGGDLKEALLVLGAGWSGTRATILSEAEAWHWQGGAVPAEVACEAPRQWLVEPDPAIIRAGLVQDLAATLQGSLLDETIAYFTTDTMPTGPALRAWRIFGWIPYQLKRLRALLREQGVRQISVKKRGSPITPEELIAGLRLKQGNEARTLVLTRLQGEPIVLICAEHPGV